MSNFKKRLTEIRKTKLNKIAEGAPAPAQISVQEDSDMNGFTTKIEEALKIQLHPVTIDGYVESYSGEITVTMSNGDTIEYKYNKDEKSGITNNELTINGQSIPVQSNFEPSQLTKIYKDFLGLQ